MESGCDLVQLTDLSGLEPRASDSLDIILPINLCPYPQGAYSSVEKMRQYQELKSRQYEMRPRERPRQELHNLRQKGKRTSGT